MQQLDFYFDIISPYAYFAFKKLGEIPTQIEINLKPVLFAGLLGHWESKGPAEIAPKRLFTYQFTHWYAQKHGIKFRVPPAHPFNPLPGLRLAIAAGSTNQAVDKVFDFVWGNGLAFDDKQAWEALVADVGVTDPATAIASPEVKRILRENTDQAIAAGVFGVPSYVVDGEVFWGVDALPMTLDFIADPTMMQDDEMRRLATLPTSAERKL